MRRPRIRFTVGTLLFAVALVAANCWYFRPYYESEVRLTGCEVGRSGRIWWYRVLPVGIGTFPLLNVVLIGTACLATRIRRERAIDRSPSPAFVFFSLHLLALGGLASLFMPEAVRNVRDLVDGIVRFAARHCGSIHEFPNGAVSWVVFDSALLGVLVSGPPLLLSWIGQIVASRYSAKVSRRRFRILTGLVSLGFAGTALAVCVAPQQFWEETNIALGVQILDETSGRPLAQAFVRMTDPFDDEVAPLPSAFTDRNGRVRLTSRFVSYGERNAFWTMGEFSPWGRWLEVRSPGYGVRRLSLTEVFGPFADLTRPGLGKISLARGEATEPFRDLAGRYIGESNGTGGRWMKIESDGRFALCNSMCVSSESQEYGYLERTNGGIKLALFPCPGRGDWPEEYLQLQVVEWGGRRYLVSTTTEELRDFCRAALSPSHSQSRRRYLQDVLVLADDLDEPLTGLPPLPLDVWAAFLADEVNLDNEDGTLSLALDSLNQWIRRKTR